MTDVLLSRHQSSARGEDLRPRRRRPIVRPLAVAFAALLSIATAIVAFFLSQSQVSVYGAQAEIVFVPSQSSPSGEAAREMTTQTLILRSRVVLRPVAQDANVPIDQVERSVTADIVGQSNLLRVTVAGHDPNLALRLARGISRTYVLAVSKGADASLGQARDLLEHQIKQLTAELAATNDQLVRLESQKASAGALPTGSNGDQLRTNAQTLAQRIGILQGRLTEIDVDRVTAARARIVTPAHPLKDPLSPTPLRSAATAAMVGVAIAAGAILLVRRSPQW